MSRSALASAVIALCLACTPGSSNAQAADRMYRVGVLEFASPAPGSPVRTWILERLRAAGYVEGRNLLLDMRSLRGLDSDAQDRLVADVVREGPDVIIVGGTSIAVRTVKFTRTIPIVMLASVDPVGAGLAQSLPRPGGNVTGLATDVDTGAEEKRLELLLEMAPHARRVALVGTSTDWDGPWGKAVRRAAIRHGVDLVFAEGRTDDFSPALEAVLRTKSEAIFVALSPVSARFAPAIGSLTVSKQMPSSCGLVEMVPLGCMMAYGQSAQSFIEHAVTYVDKILKGAKPGDLPIEQPRQFRLVINLKVAKEIGWTIPKELLIRADEVIE